MFTKFTEGGPYTKPRHIDETNHTLLPPRADGAFRQVQLFVYLIDVTEPIGATRVVSRTQTRDIPADQLWFDRAGQVVLDEHEVSAEGGAGSVLAYAADTVHRGAAMTEPGGRRVFANLGFQPAAADWIGDRPWPRRAGDRRVTRWIETLDLRQLMALGFPPPGHAYWDELTLAATARRYPALDLAPFATA